MVEGIKTYNQYPNNTSDEMQGGGGGPIWGGNTWFVQNEMF